ncbi:MAG: hypothetical protein A2Z14_05145 [Chloroflexi bacterium RBG_16_48_8]|nr:MAG: hypothetical protein A2Z14_05145 [Chloroflexi bacterium RBG_16_48_8]
MLSGGYIQLFFGDVENYTLVSVLKLLYLFLAYLFIENRIELWVPGLALSIALGFHLLAGWLIPSLIYLFILAWKKKDRKGVLFGFLGFVAPLVLLLTYFHWNGLPTNDMLYRSHALGVMRHLERYLNPLQGSHYSSLFNLIFLLLPAIILVPMLVINRRIGSDPFTHFLLLAASFMLAFVLLWRMQLSVYEDWNLVAPAMIPLSTLIAFSYANMPEKFKKELILIVFGLTATLHTSMWIVSNHFSLE